MRIESINNRNKYTPSFRAIKVAQINSILTPKDTTSIYKIEKHKDTEFCRALLNNLTGADIKRMPIDNPNIKNFIKKAIESLNNSDYAAIGIKNNKPFGLLSISNENNNNDIHLKYLATWKDHNFEKIKNGGSELISFIFNKFQNKNNINLTPAFNSDLFYYKFGFDYENEYDNSQMHIYTNEIKKQLKTLAKNFHYEEIKNQLSEDLTLLK